MLRFPALPLYLSSLLFAVMALSGKALSPPHLAALSLEWVVLLRSLIALLVLLPAVLHDAGVGLEPLRRHWSGLLLRGVAGTMSMWFYFLAIQRIPVGEAVLLSNTSPLWTAVISSVFLKESMPPRLWLAFPATFLGVLLVSWPSFHLSVDSRQWLGIAAGLVSAAFAGASYSTVRSLRGVPASWVATSLMVIGTLSALPPVLSHPLPALSVSTWLLALAMGLSGGLAQWLMSIGYQYNKAMRASTLNMTTVAFTILLAWPALDERPFPIQLGGLVMIFFGCANASSRRAE